MSTSPEGHQFYSVCGFCLRVPVFLLNPCIKTQLTAFQERTLIRLWLRTFRNAFVDVDLLKGRLGSFDGLGSTNSDGTARVVLRLTCLLTGFFVTNGHLSGIGVPSKPVISLTPD